MIIDGIREERVNTTALETVEQLRENPQTVDEILAGQSRDDQDAVDLAALTGLCSVVLNLHEFITRD